MHAACRRSCGHRPPPRPQHPPALKAGVVVSAIWMASPVWGLRPWRAARTRGSNCRAATLGGVGVGWRGGDGSIAMAVENNQSS